MVRCSRQQPNASPRLEARLLPLAEPCRAGGAGHDALERICSSCAFLSLLLVASVRDSASPVPPELRAPSQSPGAGAAR